MASPVWSPASGRSFWRRRRRSSSSRRRMRRRRRNVVVLRLTLLVVALVGGWRSVAIGFRFGRRRVVWSFAAVTSHFFFLE
ncbi:hypothetical protein LINGRAPRIM_LOCUS586 [Linum grandiflorum]